MLSVNEVSYYTVVFALVGYMMWCESRHARSHLNPFRIVSFSVQNRHIRSPHSCYQRSMCKIKKSFSNVNCTVAGVMTSFKSDSMLSWFQLAPHVANAAECVMTLDM